jgi:hypothetical protein
VDLTPNDDVLATWALDALDDDERAAVDMALDLDPAGARRALRLRRVAADLAGPLATAPPGGLREQVLATALRARATGATAVEALPAVEVYAAQVRRVADALATAEDDDAGAHVAAYGWRLGQLARHLRAVEAYFVDVLRSPDLAPPAPADGHLELGAADGGSTLRAAAGVWERSAATAVALARALGDADLAREATFHGVPFELSTLFVVRAFELWTHADDIRRALGRAPEDPAPPELRTMSDRAVRGLPGLMLLAGIEPPPVPIRVVLTGAGGGTWDVDLDLLADRDLPVTAPVHATIVADVADFCRLVSRRVDVDALDHDVEGDRDLATTVLRGAQAIAM